MAILDKREIAARQLEGAIRIFMTDGDPLAAYTLAAPASQILRDLNRSKPRTVSSAFTNMWREVGVDPNAYWKDYNALSAKIKHGRDPEEILDDTNLRDDAEFIIYMAIVEWMLNADNLKNLRARGKTGYPIREHMTAFIYYVNNAKKRSKRLFAFTRTVNLFEHRIRVIRANARMWLYRRLYNILLSI